jgi:hypothetical protein
MAALAERVDALARAVSDAEARQDAVRTHMRAALRLVRACDERQADWDRSLAEMLEVDTRRSREVVQKQEELAEYCGVTAPGAASALWTFGARVVFLISVALSFLLVSPVTALRQWCLNAARPDRVAVSLTRRGVRRGSEEAVSLPSSLLSTRTPTEILPATAQTPKPSARGGESSTLSSERSTATSSSASLGGNARGGASGPTHANLKSANAYHERIERGDSRDLGPPSRPDKRADDESGPSAHRFTRRSPHGQTFGLEQSLNTDAVDGRRGASHSDTPSNPRLSPRALDEDAQQFQSAGNSLLPKNGENADVSAKDPQPNAASGSQVAESPTSTGSPRGQADSHARPPPSASSSPRRRTSGSGAGDGSLARQPSWAAADGLGSQGTGPLARESSREFWGHFEQPSKAKAGTAGGSPRSSATGAQSTEDSPRGGTKSSPAKTRLTR